MSFAPQIATKWYSDKKNERQTPLSNGFLHWKARETGKFGAKEINCRMATGADPGFSKQRLGGGGGISVASGKISAQPHTLIMHAIF